MSHGVSHGVTITEAELLDALVAAIPGDAPSDARTMREIMDETGLGLRRVQGALQRLQAQGRLAVFRVRRFRVDGIPTIVPAYVISPAADRSRSLKQSRRTRRR